MDLSGPELAIILLVVVVIFGPAPLPKLARSIGQAQREFHRGRAGAGQDERTSRTDPSD
jgi:sec-independent protein translocase protein TatA